nr:MAG TPA: hypothetical protein [Bacteriophage sp.]
MLLLLRFGTPDTVISKIKDLFFSFFIIFSLPDNFEFSLYL